MNTVKVNVLKNIPGYATGKIVSVELTPTGVPINRFWRRRFSDAKRDNCIKVITTTKPVLNSSSEEATKPKSKPTSSKKQEKSK